MPDKPPLQPDLIVVLGWVSVTVAVALLVGVALSRLLKLFGRQSGTLTDIAVLTKRPVIATLIALGAAITVRRTTDPALDWRGWVDHTLLLVLIGSITWLFASLVSVVARRALLRLTGGATELTDADRQWRRRHTQVTTIRRLAIAVVVLFGCGAAMTTFPQLTNVSTTLFASAGVLSVVAGLAAQTSLGALFAGVQIAFSDAIRVGDIVVLEEEWGRVEEITLTYVVVRLWDQRRLVLPSTYFTTTPFQNWTRTATELLGTVEIDVDFSVPLDSMRAEFDSILDDNLLWDGRTSNLHVIDAVGGHVRVRLLMSASNADALFDLRCEVREGLVNWLRHSAPEALPRWRVTAHDAPTHHTAPA